MALASVLERERKEGDEPRGTADDGGLGTESALGEGLPDEAGVRTVGESLVSLRKSGH